MNRTLAILALVLIAVAVIGGLLTGSFATLYAQALRAILGAQQIFHDRMADNLTAIRDQHSLLASGGLMLIGFVYGMFHAVGPGHGKVVVAGYMMATNSSLKRGLVITLLASLLQAVVAVALVVVLFVLLGWARNATEDAARWLEDASFAFVILVGLGLIVRGGREAWTLLCKPAAHEHHDHDHHGHDHAHGHAHDNCCGHAHLPDAATVAKADGFMAQALMVLAIGIRPCSGAVLLLLLSFMLGVYTAGIAATFAMAIGTAITTGALAVLSVQARKLTTRLLEASGPGLAAIHAALGLLGGAGIVLLGVLFLQANLHGADNGAPTGNPLFHRPPAP